MLKRTGRNRNIAAAAWLESLFRQVQTGTVHPRAAVSRLLLDSMGRRGLLQRPRGLPLRETSEFMSVIRIMNNKLSLFGQGQGRPRFTCRPFEISSFRRSLSRSSCKRASLLGDGRREDPAEPGLSDPA